MSTTSPARGASACARVNVARPGESGRARQSRRERVLLVHATLLHSLASVAPRRTLTQATRAAVDTRARTRVCELEGREHSRTATRGCRARRIHEPAPLRAALGGCAGGRAKSAQQRGVRRLRARASERASERERGRARVCAGTGARQRPGRVGKLADAAPRRLRTRPDSAGAHLRVRRRRSGGVRPGTLRIVLVCQGV